MKLWSLIVLLAGLFSACNRVQPDAEIMAAIKAIAASCEIDGRYALVKKCRGGQKEKYDELIKKKGVLVAVNTLAVTFSSENKNLATVSAGLLYSAKNFLPEAEIQKHELQSAAVSRLLDGLEKLGDYPAFYSAQLISKVATLVNKEERLYQVLDNHPEEAVRNEGYRYLMTYGRLNTFNKVKKLARRGMPRSIRVTALAAPGSMYHYTEKEKNVVCPWVKSFLDDDEPGVMRNAAHVLVLRCGGKYIDLVLTRAEKLAQAGKLSQSPLVSALASFTFGCGPGRFESRGSQEQCKRKKELLRYLP